jgi:hypothetical protein
MSLTLARVYENEPDLVIRHNDMVRLAIRNRDILHKLVHESLMRLVGGEINADMELTINEIIERL